MSKKIYRARLILFRLVDNTPTMLFMKPSNPDRGGPEFQIPKGKIDPGETPEGAAIREAEEEVGLFPGNIVGDVHKLGVFLGRTHMFIAEVRDPDLFGDFTKETKETRWMTLTDFKQEGRELHLHVVKAADRMIRRVQNEAR